jgi:transposase-like protein
MSTKRKIHSANFKAKVALDAYKADKTSAELISTHKVTSGQISTWKKQLLDGAASLFEAGLPKTLDVAALTAPLYEEIGRLKVELDWLKKKVS